MLLLQNKKGVDDDERTEEGLDLQFVTDDVNRIESLASELAFIPEIYTIISNNLD